MSLAHPKLVMTAIYRKIKSSIDEYYIDLVVVENEPLTVM